MSEEAWDHEVEGPGAIAQVDQSRQDIINIVRDAPIVFMVAIRPGHEHACVRSFAFLPSSLNDDERHEYMTRFFREAREQLDEMVETLENADGDPA